MKMFIKKLQYLGLLLTLLNLTAKLFAPSLPAELAIDQLKARVHNLEIAMQQVQSECAAALSSHSESITISSPESASSWSISPEPASGTVKPTQRKLDRLQVAIAKDEFESALADENDALVLKLLNSYETGTKPELPNQVFKGLAGYARYKGRISYSERLEALAKQ